MVANKRKAISKKVRFEVFKRDSFTCQYCGRSAPDVVLEIDHIHPVIKGGDNNITNLITSCFDCNRGKGKRKLSDRSALEKQQEQLRELNERRIQLEMMMEWRKELMNLEEQGVMAAANYFEELVDATLTPEGKANLKKWIKQHSLQEVLDAIEISTAQYGSDDVEKAFRYIPRIIFNKRIFEDKPYMKDLYYIRGILRNRLNYLNEQQAIIWLKDAYLLYEDIDYLREIALNVRNWTEFRETMRHLLEDE